MSIAAAEQNLFNTEIKAQIFNVLTGNKAAN